MQEILTITLFVIKYKNGTQEIKTFENTEVSSSNGSYSFEIFCLKNPEIESYKRYLAKDHTHEPEMALKMARRVLFDDK
jgi:hypothetical protein